MRWFVGAAELRRIGILGMNSRNIDFISRYNPRKLYPLVDDKLKTKYLAQRHHIPVPGLCFVVREQYRVNKIDRQLEELPEFAIKPAKGSGGKGILVVSGRDRESFIKTSGAVLGLRDVKRHMSNILAGLYSLAGTPDAVIVEELIHPDDLFDGYSYEGVPDIRIIVFQGYPVMAMLRLATRESDGKANLHQGAVGVGLDIASGRCLQAVQHSTLIDAHPDTARIFQDICIPNWPDMLNLASRCHDITGLGYIGADIVLDKHRGPLLLELNARPGLSIQMANGCGLLPRLRRIETLARRHRTARERVGYAIEIFGEASLLPKTA